ncbi:hypothetical protein GGR57DRAFT_331868 [Xylariaceae sp. FL1272]|nr:hypothetical protein GGR57DRAFT_331868 [Xylariaceae sp. FL1272]
MNNLTSSSFSELLTLITTTATEAGSSRSWKQYIVPAALVYIALCRALRYRGEKNLRNSLGYPEGCPREKLAHMTNDEAQIIIKYLMGYEFPEFHLLSLQFGLFKTYAVESISKLLLATGNLTDPVKSLKRYEDTAALIAEFMVNPPTSSRTMHAIARMNFLHSKYREEGTISNEDLLYTLSVFVTEPPRFARLYEWRVMNEVELCAYGVFWKALGDSMDIKYKGLLPRDSWKDGIEWAEDIAVWAKAYEAEKMKPSVVANKPAKALIPMITYWVPWFAKPFVEQAVCVLMGDRMREAFMLPEPTVAAPAVVYLAIWLRSLFLRYLALPRLFEVRRLGEMDPKTGRFTLRASFGNYPFYRKPTLWNRWGPGALAVWLYGGKVPGDNPPEHLPDGYLWSDLGPKNRVGLGVDEMNVDVQRMEASRRGGCPF